MSASPSVGTIAPPAEQLDRERLRRLAEQAAGVRIPVLLTIVIIAALVWQGSPQILVVGWAALSVLVREAREAGLRGVVRASDSGRLSLQDAIRQAVWWNLLLGASNGSAALFMLFMNDERDAILTMIIVSLAAGAVTTSASILRSYIAYAAAMFVPTAVVWGLGGGWLHIGVAGLIVLFFWVQYGFARSNYRTFEESFLLRFEREELARRLEVEKETLSRLAQELALARDHAEQANAAKSRFLAAASHDLRQPMYALGLHAYLLDRKARDLDLSHHAHEIKQQSDALSSMLDGMLEISELDLGTVPIKPTHCRLIHVLSRLVQERLSAARQKGLTLSLSCPDALTVETDDLRLARIVINLVDNAIKYTHAGIVVVAAFEDGNDVAIEVRDTGPGIPVREQARVFEDFYQIGNPQRDRSKGSGLGLGIVRRLCGQMGFAIELESDEEEGSIFRIRMPNVVRAGDRVSEIAEAAIAPDALRGLKILVIEDDIAVRGALRETLCSAGSEVNTAQSTAEATSASRLSTPDFVLADFRLPENDNGIAAIAAVRADCGPTPALLITGDTTPERLQQIAASNVRVLRKPLSAERLLAEIAAELDLFRRRANVVENRI